MAQTFMPSIRRTQSIHRGMLPQVLRRSPAATHSYFRPGLLTSKKVKGKVFILHRLNQPDTWNTGTLMLTTLSHPPSRMILRQESRTSLLPMTLLANGGKIYWIGCPCIHQSPRLISRLSTPFTLVFRNFTWSVTETYVNLPSTSLSWTMLG